MEYKKHHMKLLNNFVLYKHCGFPELTYIIVDSALKVNCKSSGKKKFVKLQKINTMTCCQKYIK